MGEEQENEKVTLKVVFKKDSDNKTNKNYELLKLLKKDLESIDYTVSFNWSNRIIKNER